MFQQCLFYFKGENAPGFPELRTKPPKDSLCCHVSKVIMNGDYLECKRTLVGRFLKIQASNPNVILELYKVEVFSTRIGKIMAFKYIMMNYLAVCVCDNLNCYIPNLDFHSTEQGLPLADS